MLWYQEQGLLTVGVSSGQRIEGWIIEEGGTKWILRWERTKSGIVLTGSYNKPGVIIIREWRNDWRSIDNTTIRDTEGNGMITWNSKLENFEGREDKRPEKDTEEQEGLLEALLGHMALAVWESSF